MEETNTIFHNIEPNPQARRCNDRKSFHDVRL